jgi:hypothetical protein
MSNQLLEIFVLSHDRQEETIRAVKALKVIDFGIDVQITVSDNPSHISKTVRGLPSDVKHIVHDPGISATEHYERVEALASGDWVLITHDDDEMLPALGRIFKAHYRNSSVGLITGLSRIMNQSQVETVNDGYQSRLETAKLLDKEPAIRFDLWKHLFEVGTLFPASALLMRTGVLKGLSQRDKNTELAGDLELSLEIAYKTGVVFEGREPVMNYYIHGGNSVLTSEAAGGLLLDTCITRIAFLLKYPETLLELNSEKLPRAILVSKILARAFSLRERYELLEKYLQRMRYIEPDFLPKISHLPVRLFILAPLVRFLMWRKLGYKFKFTKSVERL